MRNRMRIVGVVGMTAALLPYLTTGCASHSTPGETGAAQSPRPLPADPAQAAQAARYQQQAEAEHQAVEARAQGKGAGAGSR